MGLFGGLINAVGKGLSDAFESGATEKYRRYARHPPYELEELVGSIQNSADRAIIILAIANRDSYSAANLARSHNVSKGMIQKFCTFKDSEISRAAMELIKNL